MGQMLLLEMIPGRRSILQSMVGLGGSSFHPFTAFSLQEIEKPSHSDIIIATIYYRQTSKTNIVFKANSGRYLEFETPLSPTYL